MILEPIAGFKCGSPGDCKMFNWKYDQERRCYFREWSKSEACEEPGKQKSSPIRCIPFPERPGEQAVEGGIWYPISDCYNESTHACLGATCDFIATKNPYTNDPDCVLYEAPIRRQGAGANFSPPVHCGPVNSTKIVPYDNPNGKVEVDRYECAPKSDSTSASGAPSEF